MTKVDEFMKVKTILNKTSNFELKIMKNEKMKKINFN